MSTTGERTFLSTPDVTVTQSRLIMPGQTYAMSGVTSVASLTHTPSRKGPIILILVSLVPMLSGETGVIGVSLVGIALGVVWLLTKRPNYAVLLRTASGETEAYASKDQNHVDSIIAAINDAIVARG